MKKNRRITSILIVIFSLAAFPAKSLPQDNNQRAQKTTETANFASEEKIRADSIKEAFERAMHDVDAAKARQQEELTEELKQELKNAIDTWLEESKQKKMLELNKFVPQNWEKQARQLSVSPVQYDYYLRDFAYQVVKNDIVKTDSLAAPYKAQVLVNEYMYIERYHSPSISYRNDYFYTVLTPTVLSFEYRHNRFEIFNTQIGLISIIKGVPAEVATKINKQTFN